MPYKVTSSFGEIIIFKLWEHGFNKILAVICFYAEPVPRWKLYPLNPNAPFPSPQPLATIILLAVYIWLFWVPQTSGPYNICPLVAGLLHLALFPQAHPCCNICQNFIPFLRLINDSLEKAMAPHSSTLAWKIPWTEEPGRLQSMGSRRVGHDCTCVVWKGFPGFPAHLRIRPVSQGNSRRATWVVPHAKRLRLPGPLLIRTRCLDTP